MMTTPLKIAVVSHIRFPIAHPFMGGMEAHSWHLVERLVRRGHDVTLFASGDSETSAHLAPLRAIHYDADLPWHDWHGTDRLNAALDTAFGSALEYWRLGAFDVIHNNSLHRYPPRLARRDGVAMVTSLHVPAFGALRRAVRAASAPWNRVTACSSTHLASYWPDAPSDHAHIVPNGIDLDLWAVQPKGDGTAAWSGRITPNKGADIAIAAAKRLGMDLTLYGVIEHQDYFETEIAPHLNARIRYGGHLDQRSLARAVGRASVYLFTPLWDEPFGLAAAEAMACGVPVAALPNGAVREVIADSGVIAATPTGTALAKAAQEALTFDRRAVARDARRRFDLDRMVDAYEALYRRAIHEKPHTRPTDPAWSELELPSSAAAPPVSADSFRKVA